MAHFEEEEDDEDSDEDAEPPLVSSPNDHDQKRAILGMLLLLKL